MEKQVMHSGLSGLIDELVVSESGRGTGIGHKLIKAVVDKCRELGCCEVEVSTEKSKKKPGDSIKLVVLRKTQYS